MRRLMLRAVLLSLPFALVMAFVAAIDPYDYFDIPRVVPDTIKAETAGLLHYPLWKIHQFERRPVSRILLGDSRMEHVNTKSIEAITGQPYFNFAYGGGTLTEAVQTYWIASRLIHLDAVYLETGLIGFNAYQTLDRVPEVATIDSNPLLYLTNRLVVRAAVLAVYAQLTGRAPRLESPGMDSDAFWRYQVDRSLPQVLTRYAYPTEIARQLQAVVDDCRRNGTKVVIVIPPTHTDVQRKIASLGRSADDLRFRRFVGSLAEVYDFDYPNALTSDRSKFLDPLHLADWDEVVREVWGPEHPLAHHTP